MHGDAMGQCKDSRIISLVADAWALQNRLPVDQAGQDACAAALARLRDDLVALECEAEGREAVDAARETVRDIDAALACLSAGHLRAAV